MEIGFEDLGVDLFYVVKVCAFVEVGEFLVEESSSGEPCGDSHCHGCLHRSFFIQR